MTLFLYISLAVAVAATIASAIVFIKVCCKPCTHRKVTRDEDSCYCNECGEQLVFDRTSRNWVSPKP